MRCYGDDKLTLKAFYESVAFNELL